jgi:phosphatidylinositol alpha-1,6-mannosyltransferase
VYLDFFFGELDGVASTPLLIKAQALQAKQAEASSLSSLERVLVQSPLPRGGSHVGGAPAQVQGAVKAAPCLLVASTFPPLVGGTCIVYHNLCKYGGGNVIPLVPSIDFQTGSPIKSAQAFDQAAPYRIYRCSLLRPQQRRPASHLVRFSRAAGDLCLMVKVFIKIIRVVFAEKIDVLCVGELTYCGWLVIPCKYLLGLKTIIYVHGEEITTLGSGYAERLKFKWLRAADAVVAVSNFTARSLISRAGLPLSKLHVIRNGVDVDVFRLMPKRPDLIQRYRLEGMRVLLSVGRLVERKGIDQTLRALPAILTRHSNLCYLVVGDGPYRLVLERIAEEAGISEHVVFIGEVSSEDLVAHYALCDIFVQPNRDLADGDTEGFGLVFLEANACGKPVVAGNAGGAPDAVTDGENGLLVDGKDVNAIEHAIGSLLTDPHLYRRLSQGGLARARQSSWRERTEAFQGLCTSLVRPMSSTAALAPPGSGRDDQRSRIRAIEK